MDAKQLVLIQPVNNNKQIGLSKYFILAVTALVILSGVTGYFLAFKLNFDDPAQSRKGILGLLDSDAIQSRMERNDASPSPGAEAYSGSIPSTLDEVLSLPAGYKQNLGAHLYVATLSTTELEYLLAETIALTPLHLSFEMVKVTLARYMQLDPSAAHQAALSVIRPTDPNYETYMQLLYSELALINPDLAWRNAERIPLESVRRNVRTYLLKAVIPKNEHHDKYLSELSRQERNLLESHASDQLSPEQAFQAAMQIGVGSEKQAAVKNALSRWALVDPAAALQTVDKIGDYGLKIRSYVTVFQLWARSDPAAALAAARAVKIQGLQHNLAVTSVLAVHASQDPYAALEAMNQNGLNGNADVQYTILSVWAKKDPAAAVNYIESLEDKERFASAVSDAYIRMDPDRAFAWLESIATSAQRLMHIGSQYIQQNPEQARNRIADLAEGPLRSALLHTFVNLYAVEDPQAMLGYLAQFSEREISDNQARIVREWSGKDFDAARDYVLQIQDDQTLQRNLVELIIFNAREHLDEVTPLLAHLDGANKDRAIQSIMNYMRPVKDWPEAIEWINQIENDRTRTNALISAIFYVGRQDMDEAFELLKKHGLDKDAEAIRLICMPPTSSELCN